MLTTLTSKAYSFAMKLLIIGGTRFVGRHLVDEALARGHEVTLFNRGQHADVFPKVTQIHGDRDKDVGVLKGKMFDSVIDTCGYIPRHLEMIADVLPDVPLYVFISTISVYADPIPLHADEQAPLATLKEPTEQVTNESYGALKVLCEKIATESFKNALIVRPGFIVGAEDYTGRFPYWVWRTTKGGDMLVPPANAPMQFIDAKDLAAWTIRVTEEKLMGAYNLTSQPDTMTFGSVLETIKAVSKANTNFVEVADAFAQQHDIPFSLFAPKSDENWEKVSVQKAVKTGLTFRSLEQTVQDTLLYVQALPEDYTWKTGLSTEKEQELLQMWQQAL
jgi:2'-hydroxyisoflavone reductase